MPVSRLAAPVLGFVARRPPLSRMLFNAIFRSNKGPQGPSQFLKKAIRAVKPGKALDVAMGQGRNAVLLTQLGWDVTGFDISEQAVAQTLEAARQCGVALHAVQSTSEAFDFGAERWDLILLFYAWAPLSDPAFMRRLKGSLKSGGVVIFEHFLHDGSGAPPKAAGCPDLGELPVLFAAFESLRYEEVTALPDWSPPLAGSRPRRLVRMIARKP